MKNFIQLKMNKIALRLKFLRERKKSQNKTDFWESFSLRDSLKPAGEVKVDVTLEIDKEGILHFKSETSDKSVNVTIRYHRGRIPPPLPSSLKC
jgi:molecular chaperone DnaK (HSP70)